MIQNAGQKRKIDYTQIKGQDNLWTIYLPNVRLPRVKAYAHKQGCFAAIRKATHEDSCSFCLTAGKKIDWEVTMGEEGILRNHNRCHKFKESIFIETNTF